MPIVRIIILTMLAAPCLSLLLALVGAPKLAGVLIGLAAGVLLRGEPSRAAMSTLCGSASAVLIGAALGGGSGFADRMAGWPGWLAGAVLAYLIAGRGLPRKTARAERSLALPAVLAALTAAVLGCGQLAAAKAMRVTLWEDYHEWDGPGWYRDLTQAIWCPAAAVVLAAVAASRFPGGRGRFLALPIAAWLGCGATAGPLQYVQALGVTDKPASFALIAGLTGGGIGAAAAAAGLRHAGTKHGLVAFILVTTAGSAAGTWLGDFATLLEAAALMALIALVAGRTAGRDADVESGVIAGMAGPLLIWSVYLTVGPRLDDHTSQSTPYWSAWAGVPIAFVTALTAAVWAAGDDRSGSRPEPETPPQ
ncbi:hypothetical protein MF672_017090 [Actinomadura sp. ATCC 31491]|uniref:Uncharacterized protein n=1 Tax=Actinomadura luzonensis TaxID=2805427 RepID=A0ABT0FUB3_9ACTN|nr:hypothetical protein [Actinomadura luzonensis]MCK2215491.1 hypothetical protein [Actinomadura luzonensis]